MSLDHPDRASIPAVVDVYLDSSEDGPVVIQRPVFVPREPVHSLHERDDSLVALMQEGGDCLSLDGAGLGHDGYSCDLQRVLSHPRGVHTGSRSDWYCPPRNEGY